MGEKVFNLIVMKKSKFCKGGMKRIDSVECRNTCWSVIDKQIKQLETDDILLSERKYNVGVCEGVAVLSYIKGEYDRFKDTIT